MKATLFSFYLILILGSQPAWSKTRQADPSAAPPPHSFNSLTQVARTLGVPPATVIDINSLGLDARLSWILMLVSARAHVSGARLMEERASRSWGEVVALHGEDWVLLNDEIRRWLRTGSLVSEPPSRRQVWRSSSNKPGKP
jgi:hypothetical protein